MVLRGYVRKYPQRFNKQTGKRFSHWRICSLWLQKKTRSKGTLDNRRRSRSRCPWRIYPICTRLRKNCNRPYAQWPRHTKSNWIKHLHGLRYQQPKNKNSTLWKYFAISDMLINEIYIGNMVQGKYGSVSYKTKQNKPYPKVNGILWREPMSRLLAVSYGTEYRR